MSLLLISTLCLWNTANSVNSEIEIPDYDNPAMNASLFNLDHTFATEPFAEIFSEYISKNNLQATTCSEKMLSLGASIRSKNASQESIACAFNDFIFINSVTVEVGQYICFDDANEASAYIFCREMLI